MLLWLSLSKGFDASVRGNHHLQIHAGDYLLQEVGGTMDGRVNQFKIYFYSKAPHESDTETFVFNRNKQNSSVRSFMSQV